MTRRSAQAVAALIDVDPIRLYPRARQHECLTYCQLDGDVEDKKQRPPHKSAEVKELIASLLDCLRPHQRMIVEQWFGLNSAAKTLREIGLATGTTKQAVHLCLTAAVQQMQNHAIRMQKREERKFPLALQKKMGNVKAAPSGRPLYRKCKQVRDSSIVTDSDVGIDACCGDIGVSGCGFDLG
jgi:hypothetical protein